MPFELVYVGTCKAPIGRNFGGPVEPQFESGTRFPLEVGKRTVLGKAPGCGIVVQSMIVQRHHVGLTLEVTGDDAVLVVENLGGGTHVFTDGKYFDDRVRLTPGQRFEIGGVLMFELRRTSGPPTS
ncbi:MAG TPA: FHA domain-containing protein [Kofleriaceae bacterium]|nr:FHA domain-containing protein [Kofleriaceae bacterium]